MDIRHKKGGSSEGEDPLVSGIASAREFVSKNSGAITACCVALAVIVGGALIYRNMRESNIRRAQEFFGVGILEYGADQHDNALEAFRRAAEEHRNTPIGTMSAFMMGSIYLQRGSTDEAITWFEAAVNGVGGGFVKGQALEGLATAHEEKGNIDAAVRNLERALRDKSIAHRHAAIRWKLALLNRDSNAGAASAFCRELIADTLATAYHQKAENLLAAMNAVKNSSRNDY